MKPKFVTRFPSTPDLFPFALNAENDSVMVIQLSAGQYRAISFLDQRIINPQIPRGNVQWNDLAAETETLSGKPDMIFHIGHVGSTLISRLLGELDNVLSLREPLILRNLAEIGRKPDQLWAPDIYQKRLGHMMRWLSRTYTPSQKALVKASSFVSVIAADMIPHISRSLLLYVPPERYIATILAGEASRQELAQLSHSRLGRLHANIGDTAYALGGMTEAKLAAVSWAAEMTSLTTVFAGSGQEPLCKWLNFDDFLQSPAKSLAQIAEFYGYEHSKQRISELVGGPMMRRYSKAPEYEYSTDLRAQLLQEAREAYASDIKDAILWLEQAGRDHDVISSALEIAISETGNRP